MQPILKIGKLAGKIKIIKMQKEVLFKDEILNLKKSGFNTKEICQISNKSHSYVSTVLKKYANISNSRQGYFNVDEHNCWIFPSSK